MNRKMQVNSLVGPGIDYISLGDIIQYFLFIYPLSVGRKKQNCFNLKKKL